MPEEKVTSESGSNDATLAPRPDGTLSPSTSPSTFAGSADVTLPPPSAHAAETLAPPAGSPSFPTYASPTDVTLDAAARQQSATAGAPKAKSPGTRFGDYELLEPIAKGGMGIVYKARQRKLNRIVAIKMILAGQFADQGDIDRFYVEAEAAAALSHPNIVAIHEVGEVNGQHFFSMDYIDGESLAALVQDSPLPPRRAAEFVRTIAETMQFAHDSGIVHRDLKPSNVLLDKKQRPLITDFGLAKQVSSQSQLTIAGSVVGTPSYMPPEQAAGKLEDVGPWSDLYSLGAILYELLTGRPPFRAASPFETIRQVLETEPLSPRLLNPQVPRDLETICLKCLQKARSNRYASAQELADELDRFLRGEPIHARPISRAARFWRLCKRYPVTTSAIATAVFFVLTALGVSTVAYFQTSAALAKADRRFEDAMDAVDKLFTKVSEETLLDQPGMQPLRKDLLQEALTYYQKFLKEGASDPRVQHKLASAYFRAGLITAVLQSPDDALPIYETARQMQEQLLAEQPNDPRRLKDLADTVNVIGNVWFEKRDYDRASLEYQEAVRKRRQLVAADLTNIEYQRVLANTLMNIGAAEYKEAATIDDDAKRAESLMSGRKQLEEAQKIRQAALKHASQDQSLLRDLGKGYFNLGNLELVAENNDKAVEAFRAAVDVFERLTAANPTDLDNQNFMAVCYRLLADVLSDDQADERRRLYQAALDRLQPLAQQNPDVIDYQTNQAGLLMNLFDLELQAGNSQAARDSLQRAKAILKPLVERFPAVARYQVDLAITLRELAIEQDAAGQSKEAGENLGEALRLFTALVEQNPQDADLAEELAKTKAVMLSSPSRQAP
jgi:tetratricopeptide (TPR) repeat protein/tRNA A-37 threonylcarbamoyl transferase component Bud32